MLDPHGLPAGPEWLEQLRRVKKVAAIGKGLADEIVEYVDALRAAAWPIVRALEDVGDQTNWSLGDETDRVYPWYEIEPLKRAVLGARDPICRDDIGDGSTVYDDRPRPGSVSVPG